MGNDLNSDKQDDNNFPGNMPGLYQGMPSIIFSIVFFLVALVIYFVFSVNIPLEKALKEGDDAFYEKMEELSKNVETVIKTKKGKRYIRLSGGAKLMGVRIEYSGCNLEEVISPYGIVYNTLEEKTVKIGFKLKYKGKIYHTGDIPLKVEPWDGGTEVQQEGPVNEKPQTLPEIQEWRGNSGFIDPADIRYIYCPEGYRQAALIIAEELEKSTGVSPEIVIREVTEKEAKNRKNKKNDIEPGSIIIRSSYETDDYAQGLGAEGCCIDIADSITIMAEEYNGAVHGSAVLCQLIMKGEIPRGIIRDYPEYGVRGVEIDVSRNSVSMEMLGKLVKLLSFYRMNELTVHLNDNALLVYSDKTDSVENAFGAYSAFRLESGIRNDSGESITSEDYHYTVEEFRALCLYGKALGVNVVPEIDTPAHSLGITSVFPELALATAPDNVDMLDLSKEETYDQMTEIFREYLEGEGSAFAYCDTIHIGGDEYYGLPDDYLRYMEYLSQLVKGYGKNVRMWGSLSHIVGTGAEMPSPENVTLNFWHPLWADPEEMYEYGFSLVNTDNTFLYLIPGHGIDHMDFNAFWENFRVNEFSSEREPGEAPVYHREPVKKGGAVTEEGIIRLPSYSESMRGASLVLWNDACDNLDLGFSEYDLMLRLAEAIPLLAEKTWNAMESSAGDDGGYPEFESYREDVSMYFFRTGEIAGGLAAGDPGTQDTLNEIVHGSEAKSLVLTPEYDISFNINIPEKAKENYLEIFRHTGGMLSDEMWSGAAGYGKLHGIDSTIGEKSTDKNTEKDTKNNMAGSTNEYILYAADANGNVGFVCEEHSYSFDYRLTRGRTVNVRILGQEGITTLYVDGKQAASLGSTEAFEYHASCTLPISSISEESGIKLTITDLN